jgi:hypothetical protein
VRRAESGADHAVELRLREPWIDRTRELPVRRIENAVRASADVQQMLRGRYKNAEPDFSDESVFYFGLDVPAPTASASASAPVPTITVAERARFRLSRPAKRRLDDDFYADVAIAYMAAVEAGLNPRKTLAADSGTPADTVARWIGQARKRGHLPPGEPGKVTT